MKKHLRKLLAAAYNISDEAECGDDEGQKLNNAALSAADALATLAKLSKEGAIIAATVFLEVATAPDPDAYVKEEERKGWAGTRVNGENAGRSVIVSDGKLNI